MRKQNASFRTAFTSEAGAGVRNTDSFGYVELDQYACYVVASGIDDQAEAVSARLAVDTIISAFLEAPSMTKRAFRRYLRAANRALLTADSRLRLKASVIVAVTDYARLRYGQAGNARIRLYRDGFLRMQSEDQSLSMELVQQEQLSADRLAQHEERHNLYCYLGQARAFYPFISPRLKLTDSDMVALLTRGIWEHLDDGLLKEAFAEGSDDPQETVSTVEELLLSGQPAGLESYTLAAIFANRIYNDPNRRRRIRRVLAVSLSVAAALVMVGVLFWGLHQRRVRKMQAMEQNYLDAIEYIQADNYVRAKESCQKAIELAEQLRSREILQDSQNQMKLIDSVLVGDSALEQGRYSDAQRSFLNAQNRARYADQLGRAYIDDRLERTAQYMSIYDHIALGDRLAQSLLYDKAEEHYLKARELATKLYFDKGREDAIRALERLYEQQQAEQEQQAEQQQQVAQAQGAAAGVLAQADEAFAKGDYEQARALYTAALQQYQELDEQAQAEAVQAKLSLTERRLKGQSGQQAEAADYERQAQEAYAQRNYTAAKKYYLLAKDVYAQLRQDDKVSEMTRRLEMVEMGIADQQAQAPPKQTGSAPPIQAPPEQTDSAPQAQAAPEQTDSVPQVQAAPEQTDSVPQVQAAPEQTDSEPQVQAPIKTEEIAS